MQPEVARPARVQSRSRSAQRAARHRPGTYRVAALPACTVEADDVIISDGFGRAYLLSDELLEPTPLDPADADALGMFFEPSQDSSWHTLRELRQLFFGAPLDGASA